MNNSLRLAILILGLLLAPVLFVFGTMTFNSLMTLGGPIVSIGLGIFFWRGRSKGHEMNNSLRLAILILGLLLAPVLFFFGALTMNPLPTFGGPIVSIGLGIFFWRDRSKGQ